MEYKKSKEDAKTKVIMDMTLEKIYLNGNLVSAQLLHDDGSANDNTTDMYIGDDTWSH